MGLLSLSSPLKLALWLASPLPRSPALLGYAELVLAGLVVLEGAAQFSATLESGLRAGGRLPHRGWQNACEGPDAKQHSQHKTPRLSNNGWYCTHGPHSDGSLCTFKKHRQTHKHADT